MNEKEIVEAARLLKSIADSDIGELKPSNASPEYLATGCREYLVAIHMKRRDVFLRPIRMVFWSSFSDGVRSPGWLRQSSRYKYQRVHGP